jgi:group I intron endonuclease
MFYSIYKITNQIDGKIYIGSHKTKDLDDSYMGSGKYLKYAQEKHGIENFTKEILFVYETPEEMYAKEAELVNEEFLATANTYNLKVGGFGGWDHITYTPFRDKDFQSTMSARGNAKRKELFADDEHRKSQALKISVALKAKYESGAVNPFFGKSHTLEHRQKMSDLGKTWIGNKNSQFGTMWITDGTQNKKIQKTSLIPDGWKKGRKLKVYSV